MIRNALSGALAIKVVSTGLGFAAAVVLARVLGVTGYGVYTTAFVGASMLAFVVRFGVPRLVIRETSAAKARHEPARIRYVWRWADRAVIVAAALFVVTAGGVLLSTSFLTSISYAAEYAVALMLIPIVGLLAVRSMALRGLGYVSWSQVPELIIRPGALLLMVLLLGWLLPAKPLVALLMQLLAFCIALLVCQLLLQSRTPAEVSQSNQGKSSGRQGWVRSVGAFSVTGGALQLTQYTDILILSGFMPASVVGTYRVAQQLAVISGLGTYAALTWATRKFAGLNATSDTARLKKVLGLAITFSVLIALLAAIVLTLFGSTVLSIVFGSSYASAYPILVILLLAKVVNAGSYPVRNLLEMSGAEKYCMYIVAAAGLTNVALNFILIPEFGACGAAIATLIASVVAAVFFTVTAIFHKKLMTYE